MTTYHASRPRLIRRGRGAQNSALFVLPAALVFVVIMLAPIAVNGFYAFTDWSGLGREFQFIGFDNFSRLVSDENFRRAAWNTLVFTLINTPLQIVLGLALALALQRPGRSTGVLRLIILMPIAISGVVLGFVGSLIFDPRNGLLAAIAQIPGLQWLGQNWLGEPTLAMGAVIVMNLWQWTGLTMLIFVAGLVTQPAELHEAAQLDGATPWQRLCHVTIPLLAPAITINTVLAVIGGFKVFDIVYVLTNGGPAGSTETVVARVALEASFGQYGYSAASNLTITVLIVIISFALLRVLRRNEGAS